jgi:hypothetical protein
MDAICPLSTVAASAVLSIEQGSIIAQHIRRASRNLLWTNVASVAILTLVVLAHRRELVNFVLGPFPAELTKLLPLKDGQLPFKYYLKVDYGNQEPIRLAQLTTQRIKANTAHHVVGHSVSEFLGVTLNDKLLVIYAGQGARLQSPVTGALTPLPASFRNDMANKLSEHDVELDEIFLPLMLDATGVNDSGTRCLALGVLAICVLVYGICLRNIARAFRSMGRLENHPIAESLRTYGEPADVAAHIDREARDGTCTFQSDKLLLTQSWILQTSTYGLRVVQINDVIWVYKKVTKHSINCIPTDTTHSVMIGTRDGHALEFVENNATADRFLEEVCRRAPWVVAGFSHETDAVYQKDRTSMAATVDKRRSEMLA